MRILYITNTFPNSPVNAGCPRVFAICRELTQKHDVDLVVIGSDETVPNTTQYRSIFGEMIFFPPENPPTFIRRMLHRITLTSHLSTHIRNPDYLRDIRLALIDMAAAYDAVVVHSLGATIYCKDLNRHCIYDLVDCLSDLFVQFTQNEKNLLAKLLFLCEVSALRSLERNVLQRGSPVVCIAERDKNSLLKLHNKAQIQVVPNGVDADYYHDNGKRDPNSILFTGVMSYSPNANAALYFARNVFPSIYKSNPDAQFLIVGKDPTDEILALTNNPGITVTGEVADMRPYLSSAGVYVAPLFHGTGMKNKILTAMSSKIPVIATSESAIGIDATENEHFLIANTPEEFLNAIKKIQEDSALRSRLTNNARALVEQKYSWKSSAQMMEALLAAGKSEKN